MRLIDAEPLEEILRSRCAQCSDDHGSLSGAISGCLNLVRVQPTIASPPNDPLTLEELREMDGEPVWNDTMKQWAIVDTHDRRTINVCGRWRPLSDRYYRRKPEEGM